jgi:uncharacterized protein RhaS with RHS repeats
MRFLHIGNRYYDPGLGRFLQRDPIGIGGGRNVYLYSVSPARRIDPSGTTSWIGGAIDTVVDAMDAIDKFIDDFVNGKLFGGTAATSGAATIANYTYRIRGVGPVANPVTAVTAGAYIGWNAGKGIYNGAVGPGFNWVEDRILNWPPGPPGYPLPKTRPPFPPGPRPPDYCNRCHGRPELPVLRCGR